MWIITVNSFQFPDSLFPVPSFGNILEDETKLIYNMHIGLPLMGILKLKPVGFIILFNIILCDKNA